MAGRLHDDELPIDQPLVRSLLAASWPAYAGLPLRRLDASGSSNALFRLGDTLLVRLPRQPGGSETIEKEQRWLPYVEGSLSVAVPEIVAVGRPGFGYPERWSVVRWLDGDVPTGPARDTAAQEALARDLASVVTSLRDLPVPDAAAVDPALRWYRGEPLARMDARTRQAFEECHAIAGLDLDVRACAAVWEDAMRLAGVNDSVSPRWHHADLVAENLVLRDRRLAGVLDFGGLAVGDPTVDLVVAWDVLDPPARALFRDLVGVDEATWLRGRAWALALGVMTFPYYWSTMPARCAQRLAMTRAVLADAAAPG